jgi:hypothetical protein
MDREEDARSFRLNCYRFGSAATSVLNLLVVVADHFDIRNNESFYRRLAFGTQLVGWVLFGLAILVHVRR